MASYSIDQHEFAHLLEHGWVIIEKVPPILPDYPMHLQCGRGSRAVRLDQSDAKRVKRSSGHGVTRLLYYLVGE